jgi:uncharacterized delta-60 repeat protein
MKRLFTIFSLLTFLNAGAQYPGELDPSFGSGGKVVTSITTGQDKAYGVAVQSDGKIVVVGYSTGSITGTDFTVVRYNADGSLDEDFGTGGIVVSDLQIGSADIAFSVALQSDGKIIAGGSSDNGINKDAVLVRYNSDGTLDGTFGSGGVVLTDFENAQSDEIKVVKIHPLTGKIIVGGSSIISTSIGKPVLARYLDDGSLDVGFNATGIKTLWVATNDQNRIFSVEDLAVEPNGKVSCVGWRKNISTSISSEYWAAKVLSNGDMDINFSSDGVVQYDDGSGSSWAYGMLLNATQDIVLCGTRQYLGNNSFRMLKINQNGNIPAVSVFYTGYVSGYNVASKIDVDNNGDYVFVGTTGSTTSNAFAIARTDNQNFALDNTFGSSGVVQVSFGNQLNECYDLAIQPDNKIIAIGYTGNDFGIARILGEITPDLTGFDLIVPNDQVTNQSFTNLPFDWSNAFGAVSYELQLDFSDTFDNAPQTFAAATSGYAVTNLIPNALYYWRVRATDGISWGDYSEVRTFTTASINNIILLSPANDSYQAFASTALDWSNASGAASYEVQLDVASSFDVAPQTFTPATSGYTLTNLLPETQYFWRVRAINGNYFGDYTQVWSFTTISLSSFMLSSPEDLSVNQNYVSLPLDWSSQNGATNYELVIDISPDFNITPETFATANSNYTITDLSPETQYYWRVRASNGTIWGDYTEVWSFTTNSLNNFNLISPSNNALNQNFTGLLLNWSDNIGASEYELQMDTTQNFSTSPFVSVVTSSSATVNVLPMKTYYWQVRAGTGSEWGEWSSVWSFTTSSDPNNIVEGLDENFILYPNPVTDFITIETNAASLGLPYKLFDASGSEVMSGKLMSNRQNLDIRQFAAGIYVFQFGIHPLCSYRIVKD